MSERLLEQPAQSVESTVAPQGEANAPISFRERFRQARGYASSLLELSAGIVLRKGDLKQAAEWQARLDEPYAGLLERQSASDVASLSLQQDVFITFRRDAQQIGYTDTEAMPEESRSALAEGATQAHLTDIITELQKAHPEWTPEEVGNAALQRAQDMATLLAMDSEQQTAYREAYLRYQQINSSVIETQAELTEMQADRRDRLSDLGRAALNGLIALTEKARELPRAVGVQARIAGMVVAEQFGAWYTTKSPEDKKAFMHTATGVAIAGIAGYIAMRTGGFGFGGGSTSQHAIQLASSSSPLSPDYLGSGPDHLGSNGPTVIGSSPDHLGAAAPTHVGANLTPDHLGSSKTPDHIGTPGPTHIGSAQPDHIGTQPTPDHIGAKTTTPEHLSGIDLSDAKTSDALFSAERASKWPTSIEVSAWNPTNQDGSLWGISRQLLKQSGIQNPTDGQIDLLVDALRPQAQPNGWLALGQRLDLQPALDLLQPTTK